MWIFLNDAFLSVVAHNDRPGHLHVRARVEGDLERTFPGVQVSETPDGDYRFRADIERAEVARVIADRLGAIDYPNFKGSIASEAHARHDAYMDVWSTMLEWQRTDWPRQA
jgi:hypothetical protein